MHKKQFDNTTLLYFRGTILVDLDVPLSFPVLHLSSFCGKLINVPILTVLCHVRNFWSRIVNFL